MKRNGQGQIKTCRRKQHVKTDGMKGISNLFCGIFAVGGNYNLTRDSCNIYDISESIRSEYLSETDIEELRGIIYNLCKDKINL